MSPVYETLISLEKRIGRTERERFRRRFQNGYDVDGDHLYDTWRELFREIGGEKVNGNCPCQSASLFSCEGIGFCDCLQIACPLLPAMPSVQSAATSPVNVVQSAEVQVFPSPPSSEPSPYTISTPCGTVHIHEDLCSIMLDPRRKTSTANRKRGNNALNPSNTCITGQLFVAALQSENKRKEREN